MRVVSVGDVHGREDWKLINPNDFDKIVFIGDYNDSYNVSDEKMLNNFLDLIAFKEKYHDKVILLLGNHDFQYLFLSIEWRVSGFRDGLAIRLNELFTENQRMFQIAYEVEGGDSEYPFLFTHAGVTRKWYEKHKDRFRSFREKFDTIEDNSKISTVLNCLLDTSQKFIFNEIGYGVGRGGLRGDHGSPIWADRQESRFSFLSGYHHIVGHTPIEKITTYKAQVPGSITYIDTMDFRQNKGLFHIIKGTRI